MQRLPTLLPRSLRYNRSVVEVNWRKKMERFMNVLVQFYPGDTNSKFGYILEVTDHGFIIEVTESYSRSYPVGRTMFISNSTPFTFAVK